MISFIRSVFQQVAGVVWKNQRCFSGAPGRYQEHLSGQAWQHYGFSSHPVSGTAGLLVQYDNNVVSIAEYNPDKRPVLNPGEVAIYSDGVAAAANAVVLKPTDNDVGGNPSITLHSINGVIIIKGPGSTQVRIDADGVEIQSTGAGSIKLGGTPGQMSQLANLNHTHTFTGAVSGPTCTGTTNSVLNIPGALTSAVVAQ